MNAQYSRIQVKARSEKFQMTCLLLRLKAECLLNNHGCDLIFHLLFKNLREGESLFCWLDMAENEIYEERIFFPLPLWTATGNLQ